MDLFDTHCHFEAAEASVIRAVADRARAAGVTRLMAVGGSAELNESALCAAAEAGCLCACGYDREQTDRARPPIPDEAPLAAWGEIGLDYHCAPETRTAQRTLFREQLLEARRRNLPVVIHTREADDDMLSVLREIPSRGVIHCFTGTPSFARRLLDLGFYISISGIVTFRAAENVRESARMVPDDRLLIETDAPFLSPVPLRGRPNEPAFLVHTCAALAALRGVSPEALAALTTENARRMLGK